VSTSSVSPGWAARELVGAGPLARLALRRDRLMVTVWIVVLVGVCYASAAATASLYPSEREQVAAAASINASRPIVALYGPILDVHSLGELAMAKMTVTYSLFVALMVLFVVRRHTRGDEEAGLTELVGGTAVGHQAQLAAAVGFGAAVSLLLGLLVAVANTAGGLPAAGSVAFGCLWAGTGLVAVGVTAVACQVSASARTCAGLAIAAFGALFVLRAIGDTSDASVLSWLSPFGWNTQARAYGATRWWVLLLYPVTAAALLEVARVLMSRRDLGAGLIAARPGPATGSARLRDAFALSARVHRPLLLWWTLAVAAYGLVFGALVPGLESLDSEQLREIFQRIGGAGAFRDMLLAGVAGVLGLVVTCFGIAVVGHGGSDEQDGRTEQVLATATSRSQVFAATTLTALVGATWLLLVAGVSLAIGVGTDFGASLGAVVGSALVQAPAVWVVVGVGALLFALRSQWALLGWAALVLFATLGLIGELLGLPDWVLQLSPYTHVAKVPVEPFTWGPALVLTAIAAVLLAVAWARFRTRDIG
jgi:ABC-2 type transport system permease protein